MCDNNENESIDNISLRPPFFVPTIVIFFPWRSNTRIINSWIEEIKKSEKLRASGGWQIRWIVVVKSNQWKIFVPFSLGLSLSFSFQIHSYSNNEFFMKYFFPIIIFIIIQLVSSCFFRKDSFEKPKNFISQS